MIESQVRTSSDEFRANRAGMLAAIDELRGLEGRIRDNSARRRERFEARNQLLPRERLAQIVDRGAPFLELSTLCGYKTFDDDGEANISGGRQITAIGAIAGVTCVVCAHDSGIKAGAIHTYGMRKLLRAQAIALENKLPFVQLVESAGANLLDYVPETFVEGGAMFYNMARLSAAGCPVVTVVHGSSTAGGAYMPGMSDYVVMVRGNAKAFLAGPPLVRAATGEVATDEELGGTDMHAAVTGLTEYVAEDDVEALALGREVMKRLNWSELSRPAPERTAPPPHYDIDELAGIVPMNYRQPYDVHEVLLRLTDDSDLLPFKTAYDPYTVCVQARIDGHAVGMLGNNGPITPEGAVKAAQFIQLCDQAGMPLIFLQNTTGYVVGTAPERAGIIKHGSKMIQAVSNAKVPRITMMVGASFGAGNYGMCGRAYNPRFIFGWPNYRIAVMGAEQAADVMTMVNEGAARRRGVETDPDETAAMRRQVIDLYEGSSTALHATARLWDDGLIDPRDSRDVLSLALRLCDEADRRTLRPNSYGVARF
ncbi:MAG: carboxyl transferase domain-containing protein [Alphaproteobacteria bacterium]